MGLPSPIALLRNRPLRAALAGGAVLAAGIAATEFWPRESRASAAVELGGTGLPASLGDLAGPDTGPSVGPALVGTDPVLRRAAILLGDAAFPGLLAGSDTVELPPADPSVETRDAVKVRRDVLDAAVATLRTAVTAELHPESGTLTVIAAGRRPDSARARAAAVARATALFAATERRARLRRLEAELARRQDAARTALLDVEDRLSKARPEPLPEEILDLKRPDLRPALTRLSELEARLSQVEAEHRDLAGKVNDPNFTFVVDVDQDPAVQACMTELLRSQARFAELEQRLGAQDAQARAAKSDVEAWNGQLRAARAAAVSTLSAKERVRSVDRIRTLGEQRDSMKAEFEALDARIAKERREWEEVVQAEVAARKGARSPDIAALSTEAAAQQSAFTRAIEGRIAVAAALSSGPGPSAAEPAGDLPSTPPPRDRAWPAAALAALAAGTAAAWFPRGSGPRLHGTLRTEHELFRALHLPVLGSAPLAPQSQLMLYHIDPRHPYAEAYNTIGAQLESYAADHAARTFMLAGPSPGDGRSTLAINLAISLARGGQRVILIDADLRAGRLAEFLGLPNDRGVSEAGVDASGQPILVEADALLKDTSEPNLRLLSSGPPPANPVALLKGSAFKALLAEAAQRADVILIDTPALLGAVDALLLTPVADGILFVASAHGTKREDVVYAKKLLENTHGRFAGGILTKATGEAREIPAEEFEAKEAGGEGR